MEGDGFGKPVGRTSLPWTRANCAQAVLLDLCDRLAELRLMK
jgi:hypothetical protein